MLLSSIAVGVGALAVRATATTPSTSGSSGATSSATVTSSVASSSATSSAVTTHSIAVGANGYKFDPDTITNASVGDIIEWRFYPTGHWVVRSAFGQPCIPYEDTGPNLVGFSSGPQSVATTSDDGPTFQVRVNDTEPIFFYCAASGSCVDYHMIGVINPTANETYEEQYEYAENATYQMTPGEAFPSETASSSASATAGASSAGGSSSGSHRSLSAGAIAGIAIGAAAVVVFAAALIYLFGRRSGTSRAFGGGQGGAGGGGYHGPMQEAKFVGSPGPRSPGQETFTTAGYSTAPSVEPYPMQMGQYGVMAHGMGYPVGTGTPPPGSEYPHGQYQPHYGNVPQGLGGSPPLGMDRNSLMQSGFFTAPQPTAPYQARTPPPNTTHGAPIELPTSLNPGESPLPQYSNPANTYSFAEGGEGTYRSAKPS